MLLLPMTALRPGNSSGLMPLRASHQKVLLEAVERYGGEGEQHEQHAARRQGRKIGERPPGQSEGEPLRRSIGSDCSGATRAISPKNTENTSPRASHACSPNSAMPIQVTTL